MGLFGGKNSIFNQAARTASGTVTNPVKTFNSAFNTKLPSTINIGGRSVGTGVGVDSLLSQARASLRDLDNTRVQAAKDRDNAQRGEIGKFYSGQFDTLQNINPIAVGTRIAQGENPSTSLKKVGGSYLSMGSAGVIPYAGKSSSFQSLMRDENTSKNTLGFSENFAGYSRGTSTLTDTGNLSNDDRNNIVQSYVKVGAVAGFGGWLNSLFSAPAAAPASEGAVLVESGTPYYTGAQVASADIAGTGVATGVGAAPVASAATPWAAYGSNAALAYSVLTGKKAPQSIGDIISEVRDGSGGRSPSDYFSGPNPYSDVTDSQSSYGGDGVAPEFSGSNALVLTGLIVGAYLVYRRFK